jgi:hypothetical protein
MTSKRWRSLESEKFVAITLRQKWGIPGDHFGPGETNVLGFEIPE